MANQEHLNKLNEGVETWNQWRREHADIIPDLSDAKPNGANLSDVNLNGANLSDVNLSRANLFRANLSRANLFRANLSGANLWEANLWQAHLSEAHLHGAILHGAILSEADLTGADLSEADLTGANLREADLSRATLVGTNLRGATLTHCSIYGISAWNVNLEGTKQDSLVITPHHEPIITVDNLMVAQFIYLLLNNKEIRDVIDTITSKVVLILGRFTPERKAILDALRDALRQQNYSPIVFDFEIPESRDITETVSLLARMARFVIADLTDAKSIPQELSMIIPDLPSVPIQPLLQASDREYSMFEHFRRFPWVLKDYYYTSVDDLLPALKEHIIDPAEQKVQELRRPQ